LKRIAVPLIFACLYLADHVLAQTSQIDVLVVYTAEARVAAGGEASLISKLDAAMEQANLSLANSLTETLFRLVHTAEISYTETASMSTTIDHLQGTADGNMDDVHALRTTHGADHVVLLTGRTDTGGTAGVGYLMQPVSPSFAPYAFAVVRQDQATYHTFVHEIGHNLGCHHAAPEVGTNYGAYAYSRGHRFTANATEYRTIMAYAPGTRISYFSNPDISYLGTPTGLTNANNALTIRNTRTTAANFRNAAVGSFWFKATALDNRVMLRWPTPSSIGYGNDTAHIRFSTDTYPATTNTGALVYQGTNNTYMHTNVTPGVTHYYSAWVTHDGSAFIAPPSYTATESKDN